MSNNVPNAKLDLGFFFILSEKRWRFRGDFNSYVHFHHKKLHERTVGAISLNAVEQRVVVFVSFSTSSFFVQPKTSTMTTVTLYEEMILHVYCDPLSDSHPRNKTIINTAVTTPVYRNSCWQIDLYRSSQNLHIALKWSAQATYDYNRGTVYCYPPQFHSMHVVHHKRGIISCNLEAKAFEKNTPV